ncbi:hypothetical protein Avbf_01054 [Armadillidium vulgare]|nr:hypothetical protein Avbf_01054 [Armadillidium vulgare]
MVSLTCLRKQRRFFINPSTLHQTGPEIIDASNAGCLPVKTPVDITVNDNDPSALYYPSCVMLEKLWWMLLMDSKGSFKTRDNKLPEETVSEELVVSEEKHLSCSCKCNAEAECLTKEKTHVWDSATCSCSAKDVLECSSGFQFDHADCKCFNSVLRSDLRILDFNEINGVNYNL